MALTAVAIKAAKGREKQYKLTDSDGLHLLILPSGGRYWRINYRVLGKQKTLALGVWPEVDLAGARAKRDEERRVLAKGIYPADKLKLDKIAAGIAAANTFQAVAEEWLAKSEREDLSPVTLKKNRWLLNFTYPALGRRPIADISPHELLAVLRTVEVRGRHESAKRIRATCSQVFRYAIATARADRDIAADLKGALTVPKVTHRAAITAPLGLGPCSALYRALRAIP
jgi:Arm DNA-binding domain